MCQIEVWYAYLTAAGSDQVSVNWVDPNLEWAGFLAVSFTNADPSHPIEDVSTSYAVSSTYASVYVPAGSPHRLIVQFAYFDQPLQVDYYGGLANIVPGPNQTLITDFTNHDTIMAAAGPPSMGGSVDVILSHTMLLPAFWETVALGIRQVGT
jgi:hypothetical protein